MTLALMLLITIGKQIATKNRDEGQYHLSHVFDDLLVDKISRNTQPVRNTVATQHSSTAVTDHHFFNALRRQLLAIETSAVSGFNLD